MDVPFPYNNLIVNEPIGNNIMMTLNFLNSFLTKQYRENELFEVEAREYNGEIYIFVEFEPTYERLKYPITLKDTLDNILNEVDRLIDMIYTDYKQR